MESKKINQLATNVSPQTSDLTIIGDPTTGVSKKITLLQIANLFATTGTVSSVAVTETGDALTITGSPITSTGTINIGFAGDATQYVRGDGALADFPTSTGGGSSVSYYLNSSVSQGTIGGVAYRELSKDPISGAGTDITISADGYVASYITDANDPSLLEVPGGNFNCEFYFSVNSNAHNPYVYAELYKYDGSTFTLLGSSQSVPEYLSNGTTLSPYYFAIPVATAALTITDRLAIRIFVNVDTRVVTLHTENNHLCQVVTTFSKGLISLNNLTRQNQFFATGTSGTDFNISSTTATHTFNIPDASATNRGLITTGSQTIAGSKTFSALTAFTFANGTRMDYGLYLSKGSVPSAFSGSTTNIYSDATTNNIVIRDNSSIAKLEFNNSTQTYTFPASSGTIALTSELTGGTVTSVGLSSATSGVTIGSSPITTSGTITLAIATASGSQNGLLSSTDWTTFNGKQNSITLTTTGSSGAATLVGSTLNIPNYGSALSDYVTLATAQTISGQKTFSSSTINDAAILLKHGTNVSASGYTGIGATTTGLILSLAAGGSGSLIFNTSSNYQYTFPSATGTLALTSDLSAYLPLAGGTLTGALSGTSATFSGKIRWGTGTYEAGVSGIYNTSDDGTILVTKTGVSRDFLLSNGVGATVMTIPTGTINVAFQGAATFSSSVTAGGDITIPNGNYYYAKRSTGGSAINVLGFASGSDTLTIKGGTSGATNSINFEDTGGQIATFYNGNFGIGTSSPSAGLEIVTDSGSYNALRLVSNRAYNLSTDVALTFRYLYDTTNYTSGGLIVVAKDNTTISNQSGNMQFYTNNAGTVAERMRITSGGTLQISAIANTTIGGINTNNTNGDYGYYSEMGANTSNTSSFHFVGAISGVGNKIQICGNGNLQNTNNSYGGISDAKLKENITDATPKLESLLKVRIRNYNLIGDDNKQIGVIAQELEEVFPSMIDKSNDFDKDGNDLGTTTKSVKYSVFVPMLIKAIQEQQAQIEELKAKILSL